jgi:MFS family permease
MPKNELFNLIFFTLCAVTFLALCNVAVFYNFHLYLGNLGIHGKSSGFIIGLYSLTAMGLYLTASRRITVANSHTCMLAGIVLVAVCGVAYLFAKSFWALVGVRIANGTGMFMVMAGCMAAFVAIIPADRSGLAFSLYSVAMLLPYAIMPSVSDRVTAWLPSPAHVYPATAGLLVPAAGLLVAVQHRFGGGGKERAAPQPSGPAPGGETQNLLRKPVGAILMVNGVYFSLFGSLFFLFKGLAVERGIANPGLFFTTLMGVMITIRLAGGRLFDRISKVALAATALTITGAGFGALGAVAEAKWVFAIAALFGLGMGLCVPPLNALLYLVSDVRFRGYNANMMMLTVHGGMFFGPFAGAWIVDAGGYGHFLLAAMFLSFGAAGFFLLVNPAKHVATGVEKA